VRRTRKLLREALVELIEERGFERLTVGEITERAMVSRAAFYRNYRDKYHLVEQIFDEAIGLVHGAMAPDDRAPLERWVAFFEHIDDYHRVYGALLGRRGSPWFADRMRASLAEMVTEHFDRTARPALVPTMISAMLVHCITWWLEQGRPSPPREIATRTAQIAGAVIAEAGSWQAEEAKSAKSAKRAKP
jgi:AcrR family transcriptional regulator